jgi:AbiV family abortive infection protein
MQVAEGMNAARLNAKRLIDDARLLLASDRIPTALSLAILANEEAGKLPILRYLSITENDSERRRAWGDYRSHRKKNLLWILPDLVAKGFQSADDFFSAVFDEAADHGAVLDSLKQIGFYTDCLGKAHWSIPTEVISGDLARSIVKVGEILAGNRKIEVEEVELYVKYLKPARYSSKAMREATIKWHKALVARGLISESKMEAFYKVGISALGKSRRKPN